MNAIATATAPQQSRHVRLFGRQGVNDAVPIAAPSI
jgi:hypothetical protein